MSDERDEPQTAAEVARHAAVEQFVSQLVYLLIAGGFTWCMMNRDKLWQAREWWRQRRRVSDPHARQVAEFRHEIHDIERGTDGSAIRLQGGGLYGTDAGRF